VKPTTQIATAKSPDGTDITLYEHDGDFLIRAGRGDLMTSRESWSELELARLACARLDRAREPVVLIGGLGMGYTLRMALNLLAADAKVVVAELVPEVVAWNRDHIGELTGHPLRDPRVEVHIGDVSSLIRNSYATFDAIMLDIDNGPEAMSSSGNSQIYSPAGVGACMDAMPRRGCLAVWSASICPPYERRLRDHGLFVRRYRVPARKGGKSLTRCIVVGSQDKRSVPNPKTWFPSRRRTPVDDADVASEE
jgi:spermidine synthase